MNLKKIAIYGGGLWLALKLFRSQARAAKAPDPEEQGKLTAFDVGRM